MNPPDGAWGLLLHYAEGHGHPRTQGSLSVDDFRRLLDACGDRVRPARQWLALASANLLTDDIAVTIDDGLREAMDVFLSVLEGRGLSAFLNPYTQPLVGVPHSLEANRAARNRYGVDDFYARWRELMEMRYGRISAPWGYLADYGYLTADDRDFRFWRNAMADPQEYETVMRDLGSEPLPLSHWLSASDIRSLRDAGHVVGLHSHTHPTTMAHLTREQQETEWATARYVLENILGEPVTTAAWPCGQVTDHGIAWMKASGITLAWGATMAGSLPWAAPRWSSGYFRSA